MARCGLPHLCAGTRQSAVRLPPAVLPPGQRSNAIPYPAALAYAGYTQAKERAFRVAAMGLSASPVRHLGRERSRAHACRHQHTARFTGVSLAHRRLPCRRRDPGLRDCTPQDRLITGLADCPGSGDKARLVRALSFVSSAGGMKVRTPRGRPSVARCVSNGAGPVPPGTAVWGRLRSMRLAAGTLRVW